MSRYVDLFLAESREHLGAAHVLQSRLEQHPGEPELWRDFMRCAHSLKGMAAAMRFPSMVALAHAAETLAERLETASPEASAAHLPLLGESLACLGSLLDRIERGEDPASPRADELARALRGEEAPVAAAPTAAAEPPEEPDAPAPAPSRHWRLDLRLPGAALSAQRAVSIVARIGELGRVVQSSLPALSLETGSFHGRLRLVFRSELPRAELEREIRSLVGSGGFTLESAPGPAPDGETSEGPGRWIRVRTDKLDTVIERLLELRRDQRRLKAALPHAPDRVRHHLERTAFRLKELYGAVSELRLLPFETVAQRLHQAVHDLAAELGKAVRFEILGGEVLLDRSVLDALVDPLLHALKNAVDHGLEPEEERLGAGKPAKGQLRLSLHRAGDRVDLVVADDGRGMHPDTLRRAAVARGVLSPEDAADLTDDEALLLTTLPRFTTRRGADHISGRGVGLDVVRDRLESIGGFVALRSRPGRGCELHMSVPLRRALIRTLLVRCAGEPYAIPLDAVVRSIDLENSATHGGPDGGGLELIELEDRLSLGGAASPGSARRRALVLAAVEPPCALVVDEVMGRHDLVVQPLHAPLTHLREYSGAALLEDGSIAVVLDPPSLARPSGFTRGAFPPSNGSGA
jgi:two-component system chemotaxis sensor kinase CheA